MVNYHVIATVPGSRDKSINKRVGKSPLTVVIYIFMRKTSNKQINIFLKVIADHITFCERKHLECNGEILGRILDRAVRG